MRTRPARKLLFAAITLMLGLGDLTVESSAVSSPVSPETAITVKEILDSLAETLSSFEVEYSFSTKMLPGFDKWREGFSGKKFTPDLDKDGFNSVYDVKYKRQNEKFYISVNNRFNGGEDVSEYHSDGTLVWVYGASKARVDILAQAPNLPWLYDNILKTAVKVNSDYGSPFASGDELLEIMKSKSDFEVVSRTDDRLEIRIYDPSASPIQGVMSVRQLVVRLTPSFEIESYSRRLSYRNREGTRMFHPRSELKFSDYVAGPEGAPRIPTRIEGTEWGLIGSGGGRRLLKR